MAERADMSIEGASAQLLLPFCCNIEELLEERLVSFLSRAGISHLSHLLDELPNALAVLERAASFESRTVFGQAFALSNKDGIWAQPFAKSWALEHDVIQSNAHGSLQDKEKIHTH